jgi:hypothetical protein
MLVSSTGKSMKKYTLPFLVLFLSSLTIACKKEKSPELEITVLNSNNEPARNVTVRTSVPGAEFGLIEANIIDSMRTDAFGKAFFEFDNTILIRVDAYRNPTMILDSIGVLLETKRLRGSEENYYERTMRIP